MQEIQSDRFTTFKIESWRDFDDYDPQSVQGVYRGQGRESWPLRTAYERKQRVQNPMREQGMLQRFVSQAGIYADNLPSNNDYVSWFSLMQHYGAGTRLLDVTRSRYIALFISLMGMVESKFEEDGAVWLFKTYASNRNFYNALMAENSDAGYETHDVPLAEPLEEYKTLGWRFANEFIRADWAMEVASESDCMIVRRHLRRMRSFLETGGVMEIVPARSNKRMVAQAAEFLMPITLRRSFEDNLLLGARGQNDKRCTPEVVKFVIPKEKGAEFLRKLQGMNITYQTIYPDIAGLAMSVNM